MPQVSVIIPVHNTAPYLRRCVDSVRNQTLRDLEIILVDNLSTDGSSIICDEYSLIDSRIKTLHLNDAGPSVARNAGLQIASAPFIGFIDSDDRIESTMYEDLFSALVVNNADLVYCNFCYEFEDGTEKQVYPNSGKTYLYTSKESLISILLDKVSSSPCTKLYNKKLFDTLKFPEGVFYEDHSTVYKWVAMCDKVVWLDHTYYHYLQREGSTCHNVDLRKQFDFFIAEYGRLDFISDNSLFDDQERTLLTASIVKKCTQIFKFFMRKPNHNEYKQEIREMRKCFRQCMSIRPKIASKEYLRLIKIVYFWPIYYWLRYKRFA